MVRTRVEVLSFRFIIVLLLVATYQISSVQSRLPVLQPDTPLSTSASAVMSAVRPITQVVKGQKMMEGAGVRICRTIGTGSLRNLDPFLMLDELKMPANEATAGFPDHPHRGFETCTIVLEGKVEHRDSMGNHGVIGPGGLQWMTAGRGVVHSEFPAVTTGNMHGFQLWVNLPKSEKMCKPRYQDLTAEDIPVAESEGASVRVMAGASAGVAGPIKMRNPGLLLDVRLQPGVQWEQAVPRDYNGFAYVYEGAGRIGSKEVQIQNAYVLGKEGDKVQAQANRDVGLKFLLVMGKPTGDPIVQYGPFVMTSMEEIQQAFTDYQTGRLQNPEDNPWVDDEL